MKKLILFLLLVFTQQSFADECAPVLKEFLKKVHSKGFLQKDKNDFPGIFDSTYYVSFCITKLENKNYKLYLHPDDTTIVVTFTDDSTNKVKIKGPFRSAYKK